MENFIRVSGSNFNDAKQEILNFVKSQNNGNDASCFIMTKWKNDNQIWVYQASSKVSAPMGSPAFGRSLNSSIEEGNLGFHISESCIDKKNTYFQYGVYTQFMSLFSLESLTQSGEIAFPILIGSEKQQKWGNDLRNNLRKLFWNEEPFMLFLSQKEKASYFIDLQNASIPSELEDEFDDFSDSNLFKSFKMNDLKPLFLFANGLLK